MNPNEDIPLPEFPGEEPFHFTCPEKMKISANEKYCYAISYWFHFKYLEYQYLRHGFN